MRKYAARIFVNLYHIYCMYKIGRRRRQCKGENEGKHDDAYKNQMKNNAVLPTKQVVRAPEH